MGKEVISVHIGQAGVQLGNAVWELYCLEHAVRPDGIPVGPQDDGRQALFAYSSSGCLVPRAIFCDLEPTCIDEIRTGSYRRLFSPDTLINGKEDAASNFARGYYSVGNEMSELCMDRIRRQAEVCDNLASVILFRSFGGGTGSGLGANIMQKLRRDYGKLNILEFSIYPAPRLSPIVVEPYNAVLTTHATIDKCNCDFIFDNEAIYRICDQQLDVKRPTYTNLNRLIAEVLSGVTCFFRFPNSLNAQLNDILTNLVPFPRIHFPLVSFSPFLACGRASYANVTTRDLLSDVFNPANQMIDCNPTQGQYMSCVLMYRGDVSPGDVNDAVARIKQMKSIKFVDYSPTGFKVGICYQPMTWVPGGDLEPVSRSLVMMSNNSAIGIVWKRINVKFSLMFGKRAFIHHYVGEGMEEGEFREAKEDLTQLEKDYVDAGK